MSILSFFFFVSLSEFEDCKLENGENGKYLRMTMVAPFQGELMPFERDVVRIHRVDKLTVCELSNFESVMEIEDDSYNVLNNIFTFVIGVWMCFLIWKGESKIIYSFLTFPVNLLFGIMEETLSQASSY